MNKLKSLIVILLWQILIVVFVSFNAEFAQLLSKTFISFGLKPSQQPFGMVMNTIICVVFVFILTGFVIINKFKKFFSKKAVVTLYVQYVGFWITLLYIHL